MDQGIQDPNELPEPLDSLQFTWWCLELLTILIVTTVWFWATLEVLGLKVCPM